MKSSVQARLDEETKATLNKLVVQLGWTTSEVVREGIRLVEKRHVASPRRKMIGVSEFESGIPDLATNKKHMEDYGVKSMGKGWQRPEERSKG